MGAREEYQTIMERQLNEWKSNTERFKTQADELGGAAKAQFDQQLDLMRAKQDEAWDNFSKLKAAGDDAWQQWKSKLDKTWNEMTTASEKLTNQFRKT